MMEQIQYKSVADYKEQIYQKNVAYYVESFISQKLGQEAELNLQCAFSKVPVNTPIRHQNLANIKCIFEIQQWLEFFETKLNDQSNFSCPGCKQYVYFSDFGVDFTLFNILKGKQLLEEQSGQKLLNDKIIYSLINGKAIYYAILKQDKTKRINIPGCNPIIRIQVKKNDIEIKNLNTRQLEIYEQSKYTISKLQELITQKIYKGKQNGQKVNQMKESLKAKTEQLKNMFRQSQNLIELGVKSLETQFVFGLKKLQRDGKNVGSVLIVYYPHLGIWADYDINTTPEKHFQYEFQLYAKDQSQEKENVIYAIGGRVKNLQATNIFVKIRFPKDPFTQESQAIIEYLPNLPNEGFNYLGGCYNNNVYIFCGQKRTADQSGIIVDTIYDVGYVFKNGKWNKLNQKVEKRFDGSCTIIYHKTYDKCLLLYGGIEQLPDGRSGYNVQEQQHITQVFQFKQEKFLGNGFQLKFSEKNEDRYQKFMLSSPVFSVPYGSQSELLISGEFLKKNWKESREVYIFDWADGTIKINQLQRQPLEFQLLSQIKRNYSYTGPEFIQPIQDVEGAFLFGNYCTIIQEDIQKDFRTSVQNFSLFEYKVANGQVSTRPYMQREISIQLANQALSKVKDQENKVL